MNEIQRSVHKLGGYEATGRICGVTGKAVMKWAKRGRLPRTEATGETRYADLMAAADPAIDRESLLATVRVSTPLRFDADRRRTSDRRAQPCPGRRASDKGQAA